MCSYLQIDNPESFDALIYEYYSKIAKNSKSLLNIRLRDFIVKKLNDKVTQKLNDLREEEYELKIKLASAKIKVETLLNLSDN